MLNVLHITAAVVTFPQVKQYKRPPLLSLHAVEDETQEYEGVVAVKNLHIFHNSLTHLSKVAGF